MQFPNPNITDAQLPPALRALLRNRRSTHSTNVNKPGQPWSKRVITALNMPNIEIYTVVRHRFTGETKWGIKHINILYSTGAAMRIVRNIR